MALNRIILLDISRQQKKNLAIASADVAYCYDCVVYPFVSLACRKVGMPKNVISSFFQVIQDVEMFLRTGYGDSSTSFLDALRKFQGLLQGNGAAPAIWLLVSMFLILLLKSFMSTLDIRVPLLELIIKLLALVFIDDMDLFTFALANELIIQTAMRL